MNGEVLFPVIETKSQVLQDQAAAADRLRKELNKKNTVLINLMASPGAGKTTTLVRTLRELKDRYRIGVIEADADGDEDARIIAKTGVRVVQVHTGGSCHMDVKMTEQGLEALEAIGTEALDVIFLENVGNLVCPAEFDVGAQLKVMLLSTPEGHDKPWKYPLMFQVSDCLLVNKMDVAEIFSFDLEEMKKGAAMQNPGLQIIPVSAVTGAGYPEWISWLTQRIESVREGNA